MTKAQLRAQLGDELYHVLRTARKQAHADLQAQVVDVIADALATHTQQLLTTVKEQHGDAGVNKVLPVLHEWAGQLAADVLQQGEELTSAVQHIIHGTRPPTVTQAQYEHTTQQATRRATAATLHDYEHYLRQGGALKLAKRVQRVAQLLERL
jgi:hypothetical protein